jgi:glutathione S-transferase
MALAHKGLDVETVPWRFTDKDAIAPSGQDKVPVLVEEDRWIADSWAIANHLEERYPAAPSLFGGGAGRALTRYAVCYADTTLAVNILGFVLRDILDHLHEKDREYFRKTREARVGTTLEAYVADRAARLPAFRDSLTPLRTTLRGQSFLGGDAPLYADYAVFSMFQWARCVSSFELLAPDDPVFAWRDRMLDSQGGLARAAPACS